MYGAGAVRIKHPKTRSSVSEANAKDGEASTHTPAGGAPVAAGAAPRAVLRPAHDEPLPGGFVCASSLPLAQQSAPMTAAKGKVAAEDFWQKLRVRLQPALIRPMRLIEGAEVVKLYMDGI